MNYFHNFLLASFLKQQNPSLHILFEFGSCSCPCNFCSSHYFLRLNPLWAFNNNGSNNNNEMGKKNLNERMEKIMWVSECACGNNMDKLFSTNWLYIPSTKSRQYVHVSDFLILFSISGYYMQQRRRRTII